jgi:hypothetical protein
MALESTMTGQQIVDAVLRKVGNTTIEDDAKVELQNIVNRLHSDYRWPFDRRTATGSIAQGDTSISLPAAFEDLWDRWSVHLTDSSGNILIPLQMSFDEFDQQIYAAQQGPSTRVVIDLGSNTARLYMLPDRAYTYSITYKIKATTISDWSDTIDFPNDSLLQQLLFVWACQYEDDDRYPAELGIAKEMLKEYRKKFNVSPTKKALEALSPATFPPMGALR